MFIEQIPHQKLCTRTTEINQFTKKIKWNQLNWISALTIHTNCLNDPQSNDLKRLAEQRIWKVKCINIMEIDSSYWNVPWWWYRREWLLLSKWDRYRCEIHLLKSKSTNWLFILVLCMCVCVLFVLIVLVEWNRNGNRNQFTNAI